MEKPFALFRQTTPGVVFPSANSPQLGAILLAGLKCGVRAV